MRKFVKSAMRRLGVDIQKAKRGMRWENLGYIDRVDTIIDVGVGYGTPHLYNRFPDAYLVMVEPIPHFKAAHDGWLSRRPGEAHYVSVGDVEGEMEINFREDHPEQSSLLVRSDLTKSRGERIESLKVRLTPLDEVTRGLEMAGKTVLLKIDTQGNELKALKGAARTLESCKYVIIHMSVAPRFTENYEPWEIEEILRPAGFRLKSILNAGVDRNYVCRFADFLYEKAA